jgi:aldehyde:ferredoxin oxidoreductase
MKKKCPSWIMLKHPPHRTVFFMPWGARDGLPDAGYKNYTELQAQVTAGYMEIAKELNAKPWPCKYCVIQCHNLCEVTEGPYQFKGKGPEYESFAMMGYNTMCADIKAIAYACELADKYSMDTISLGGIIAFFSIKAASEKTNADSTVKPVT